MAAAAEYGRILREVIDHYAQYPPSNGQVRVETVIDEAKGHYELIFVGWSGVHRIHGSFIHADLIGDKVWIEHDGVEDGLAPELVRRGIPADRIVLGYKHPSMRKYTDYAVA